MSRGGRESLIKDITLELRCEGWVEKRAVSSGWNTLCTLYMLKYGGLHQHSGSGDWNVWADMNYFRGGNGSARWLNMVAVGNEGSKRTPKLGLGNWFIRDIGNRGIGNNGEKTSQMENQYV